MHMILPFGDDRHNRLDVIGIQLTTIFGRDEVIMYHSCGIRHEGCQWQGLFRCFVIDLKQSIGRTRGKISLCLCHSRTSP